MGTELLLFWVSVKKCRPRSDTGPGTTATKSRQPAGSPTACFYLHAMYGLHTSVITLLPQGYEVQPGRTGCNHSRVCLRNYIHIRACITGWDGGRNRDRRKRTRLVGANCQMAFPEVLENRDKSAMRFLLFKTWLCISIRCKHYRQRIQMARDSFPRNFFFFSHRISPLLNNLFWDTMSAAQSHNASK